MMLLVRQCLRKKCRMWGGGGVMFFLGIWAVALTGTVVASVTRVARAMLWHKEEEAHAFLY
jgi:hypothetical protein